MAQGHKIFKANLQIADMDRHYYDEHLLTIAQHPSETDERVMIRVLAFALNATERLVFADSISDASQADIWDKDYDEQVSLWIMLGLPDEKRIRKAVSRAKKVIIYSYGGNVADIWFKKLNLNEYSNLNVINISSEDSTSLSLLASRGMTLNFTIQDGEVMISSDSANINIIPRTLK